MVNYLNTLPLLYGLERSPVMQEAVFLPDFPSRVAQNLKNGEIDAGFIPAAVLPEIPSGRIFSSYCISSDGPVASVCLMSEVPLAEIETVLLDYQSRTSVELLKLLFRDHWKKSVRFVEANAEFQSEINGTTAGLLIGDRCLAFRDQARYIYDLGDEWKNFSGLPFVFAVWVSRIPLPEVFLEQFDAAQAWGLQQVDEVVRSVAYTSYDLGVYYKRNIHYVFGDQQQKALDYFLSRIAAGQSALIPI